MNPSTFNRNLWLLNTIYQAGPDGLSFEEIGQQWLKSGLSKGHKYPLRSFHNHRKEISDTFNISIRCRKNTNRYYIKASDTASQLMIKILGEMSLNQALHNNDSSLFSFSANTGGEGHLSAVASAIQNKRRLHIVYEAENGSEKKIHKEVKPLGIKEYRGFWYLLGQGDNSEYEYINLAFALEITPMEESPFDMRDEPIQELLVENYGGTLENIPTEEITFKTSAETARYLKRFPLHPSQRVLEEKPTHSIFYLNLKPTSDFILDLMAFGNTIEIITPAVIKEKIINEARKIIKKNQ